MISRKIRLAGNFPIRLPKSVLSHRKIFFVGHLSIQQPFVILWTLVFKSSERKKNQIFSIGIQSKLTRFSVGFHSSVANFCDTNIIRNWFRQKKVLFFSKNRILEICSIMKASLLEIDKVGNTVFWKTTFLTTFLQINSNSNTHIWKL